MRTYIDRYGGVILLSISVIIGIGIIVQYILPKYDEVQGLRATIETQKTQRDELLSYVAYLEELASTTLEIEEAVVNYALPSENDVVSLIVTYEGLSQTENVRVSPFDLTPGLIRRNTREENTSDTNAVVDPGIESVETGGIEVKELAFEMDIETDDIDTALSFIREIYKTRRVFNIKSLVWTNPNDEGSEDEPITVAFKLATYYYETEPAGIASRDLVQKGKTQNNFIDTLKESKVYEQLVLDSVLVGKEDLFTLPDGLVREIVREDRSPAATAGAQLETEESLSPTATQSGVLTPTVTQ